MPDPVDLERLDALHADLMSGAQYAGDAIDAMLDAYPALSAELRRLREERRWIPVGERVPERPEYVLACQREVGEVFIGWRGESGWFSIDSPPTPMRVSHWMPLPEPPEVSDG